MKKKTACIFVIAFIITNLFLFPTPVTNNQPQLSLVLLEARADEPGETDPTDPGDEYPPLRPFSKDLPSTAFLDLFF